MSDKVAVAEEEEVSLSALEVDSLRAGALGSSTSWTRSLLGLGLLLLLGRLGFLDEARLQVVLPPSGGKLLLGLLDRVGRRGLDSVEFVLALLKYKPGASPKLR